MVIEGAEGVVTQREDGVVTEREEGVLQGNIRLLFQKTLEHKGARKNAVVLTFSGDFEGVVQ